MKARKAFTLIELLVVISVIVLLMAILLPTLSRVRKQARAIGCQANLRQWGLLFSTELTANNAELVFYFPFVSDFTEAEHRDFPSWGNIWPYCERRYGPQIHELFLCPMASRVDYAYVGSTKQGWPWGSGGTFSAHWVGPPEGKIRASSYGFNWVSGAFGPPDPHPGWRPHDSWWWQSVSPTNARPSLASIPLMFDCIYWAAHGSDKGPPPPYESVYLAPPAVSANYLWSWQCINRHDGGVNYLFFDWSVRKVGLKELWTLKWNPLFDTGGPWTRAGGVRPEDWPQWMRRFKDY